jgi:AmmeMemoRadiSam system protein A
MTMASAVPLSEETRRWLLGLARHAVASAVAGEVPPSANDRPKEVDEGRGCFVTLHRRNGELRGCIGTFDDAVPLWRNIIRMAEAAACHDPRFAPVEPSELGDCYLEISALTPRRPARPEDIVVGEHGIWIVRGPYHGVLLPQVATEYGWDRDTFLEHTCGKAGLPRQAWREPGTEIFTFSAEVFSEPH